MKKKFMSMAAIAMSLLTLSGCDSGELAKTMSKAGLNTLMGMGVVFVVLIFISFVIALLGFIPKMFGGNKAEKKETKAAQVSAPAPVSVPEAPAEELVDDLELVAVITAAIMASMGDEAPADGLVVRSIKKRNPRGWKNV